MSREAVSGAEQGVDAILLQRTAAGDDGAYRDFVARHEAGVWQRARTLTQSEADAEDLLQEVFLAAWRGASTYRGGSARAWLLTILGHAWSRMRRPSRQVVLEDDETLESLALRAGWGTVGPLVEDEASATIAEAFARLSDEDRRILSLRDIDGVSGEETAAMLGLTVPAMKSRLHRARLRLAAVYQEVRDGSP
ncbi:MAG: RNA polymerase sigma factor [Gemmatimonadetes bacterium]|nr:RNA polymerase sigma factor [Gemmatimonadota bacterium]